MAELPKLRVEIPEKMEVFYGPKRYKVAHGGRGGGKSWAIARLLLAKGFQKKIRVLCTREIQKSLKQSVYKLLSDQITAMGLERFYDVQRDVIIGRNGTEFSFAGLQGHTMDSLKSYESVDICWVEEAHSVASESWKILTPTIRRPGSEIWISFNPDLPEDEVYARFITRRPADAVEVFRKHDGTVDWSLTQGTVLIEPGVWESARVVEVDINWRDNKWFTEEAEDERRELKALNDDVYQHVWEGKCRSAAGLMLKRHWFKRYDVAPPLAELMLYLSSDYAVTPDGGDFTVHGLWGLDCDGNLWALAWWYGQTAPEEWIQAAAGLIRYGKPRIWFDEMGVIRRSQDAAIEKRLRELSKDARNPVYVQRIGLPSTGNKAARMLGFAARASAGSVWIPATGRGMTMPGSIAGWEDRLLNQLCAFTGQAGKVDDDADVCSLMARGLDQTVDARPVKGKVVVEGPKPFTAAWFEREDRKAEIDAQAKARYYA